MAYRYTNNEYADMYLIFGAADCVSARAARLYAERYPNRVHPDRKVFERLDQRIRMNNCLVPRSNIDAGPNRWMRRNIETEEAVLNIIERDPTTSTRAIARELNMNHVAVHRILKNENLYPFHYTLVQELTERDHRARENFCRWLLRENEADENFFKNIMWTDESLFTRTGLFNCHNMHVYDVINPHVGRMRSFQHRWKLNFWAGILGDRVIGPSLLPDTLTGENYFNFLTCWLPELLEEIPLLQRTVMLFQQDGAPPHGYRRVTQFLNERFPDRWIAQRGPIRWPARSPDLTPMDFFFWGHLKSKVYETEPMSPEEVIARVQAAVANIEGQMLGRVRDDLIRRAEACIEVHGAHFEHLLN